jgi:PP-loop superfamily ATP-utilizing enzyme
MNLLDMFEDTPGYRTEKEDNTSVKLSDVRKTQVTIKQLNRLRIMNDVRKLEHEQELEKVKSQYKAPPAEGSMP